MTKKLLLPTRIQRTRIRQENVLHCEKSSNHCADPKAEVESFPSQAQPTSYNGGYEEQPTVDWFGNPLQQQPQCTGYSSDQYPLVPAQQTEVLNGHAPELSDQPTGFGLCGPQPLLPQQSTTQPQPTALQPTGFPTGFVNLAPAGNGTSVQDHNRHCEATENGARLEKWIEDQKALEQEWFAQRRREAAVSESNTRDEQYPSPPALPPRPKKLQVLAQSHGPTSQRTALLQQIREVASGATGQETTAAQEHSYPCMADQSKGAASQSPGSPPSVDGLAASEAESRARPLGCDVDVDVSRRGIAPVLDELGPCGSHQANVGVPTKCSRPCDVCTIYYGAQTGCADQRIRKSAPPPIPPKPKDFQAESDEEADRSLSPTNSYHFLIEAVRHASTALSTRIYTSNCGNFKVEAELLDWKDGRVWLRKVSGVKIAVPLSRFSGQDVEYVVTEMMRRVDERRLIANEVGSYVAGKQETTSCGIQAKLQAELEGAYAVETETW